MWNLFMAVWRNKNCLKLMTRQGTQKYWPMISRINKLNMTLWKSRSFIFLTANIKAIIKMWKSMLKIWKLISYSRKMQRLPKIINFKNTKTYKINRKLRNKLNTLSREIAHNFNRTGQPESKEFSRFYRIRSSLLKGTTNSKEILNFHNFLLLEKKARNSII